MDVVYILGTSSTWSDNELRYSLRSLDQYVRGVQQVYVVGARPSWLTNVVHLPYSDKYACKERNIMEKVAYACGHPDLSHQFLHVHDDHLALAPVQASDVPNYAGRPLAQLAKLVDPRNHWRDAVVNTDQVLQANGHTTHNFDVHFPIVLDKDLYPEIMDRYNWRGTPRGFVVKSLYANTLGLTPTPIKDLKLRREHTMSELVKILRGQPWFSLPSVTPGVQLRELLAALYPQRSKYER